MLEFIGFSGALLIGIVLGITGGGGSILTVPIFVYVLAMNPLIATSYSLFVVGTTSAFGTFQNFKKGLVEPATAVKFAIPSLLGVYLTRKFIIHRLPEVLFYFGSLQLTKAAFLMILFAAVMFMAAYSMLTPQKEIDEANSKGLFGLIIQLFFVGMLIGLIGAGGGFLIIPALVKIAKLPMKKAIGTSLLIIAINSFFGFIGDVEVTVINWGFLLPFTGVSVIGIFIGLKIQQFIDENLLKKIFGIFVLVMSILILYKELIS